MKLNVDDLVEQGLVKKKTYTDGKYKGLSVLKYTKKVFFKNLWHLDGRLLECRGTVVDEKDNIIVLPFKKVFNIGENGTQIDPEREVVCPVKVNGFMLAVTNTKEYGLIVSTTGTLDSEFAKLGRKWVDTLFEVEGLSYNKTYIFEVCDKSDTHIVDEEEGIYLIGIRDSNYGLWEEDLLDIEAVYLGCKRPKVHKCEFKDLDMDVKHEGFMIRDAMTGETLAKCKSNFYLVKKALLRMGKNRASLMFNNSAEFKKQIDEEYYDLHKHIVDKYSLEDYITFTQEERRIIFEEYFNE